MTATTETDGPAAEKLDEALRLLDELDSSPLSQINAKLDEIATAVAAAKAALTRSKSPRRRETV
jgi:hypothetical protein